MSRLTKWDGILFILGFVLFVLGYRHFKTIEIDSIFLAISITGLSGVFFIGMMHLLIIFHYMKLFPIVVVTVFILKVSQNYFDPKAVEEYEWLNYLYFIVSLWIVIIYWIKYKFKIK